jgi:hypothetical protein
MLKCAQLLRLIKLKCKIPSSRMTRKSRRYKFIE